MPAPLALRPRPSGPRRLRSGLAAGLLLLAGLGARTALAAKGISDGLYYDREGKAHRWNVERSHLLTWDEKPYAPAGVVFHSAYLKSPGSENLEKDAVELDRLKAAGVLDVWVDAGRGLLSATPEQLQAVIDHLEARGFRYGLRVGDRSREPLIGWSPVVAAVRVPVAKMQPGTTASFEVPAPKGRRVAYTLAEVGAEDRIQNWAFTTGEALVEKDRARVDVTIPKSKLLGKSRGMLFTVPEIQVEPEELGSFGDLWSGMESYQERLKKHLAGVKFGPGLRFLLDPFAAGDGTVGQEDMVFPSSASFRKGFRDWLAKRGGIATLNITWRLNDTRVASLDEAARLVPTWAPNDPPEGDGWLIDPVDRAAYRCIPRQCSIWTDLEAYRADSLKRWMNTLAAAIKRQGPNVPVLFSWSAYHPLFTNSPSPTGYDGLAGQLAGDPGEIARNSAAYALAQAEAADRNTWLIAARLAAAPDSTGKPSDLGNDSRARADWEAVREVGFRGVYFDPATVARADEYAKQIGTELASDVTALQKPVPVCFFPTALATADRVTRLSNGVWWLPSGAPTRLLRYGDSIMGYEIDQPFGSEHAVGRATALWSASGPQPMTFHVDNVTQAEFFDSAGQPLKLKSAGKRLLRVQLTAEPIFATGLDTTQLFPLELTNLLVKEFGDLLAEAERKNLDVKSLRIIYEDARRQLSPNTAITLYSQLTPYVTRLREGLTPYIWIEGERPVSHNLTGVTFQAGTSGGTYLRLDRPDAPVSGVYRARYAVMLAQDSSYEIWIAGRIPGSSGVSPLTWQIDEEPAVEIPKANAFGTDYATGMGWYSLGRVTLKAGRHELTLVIPAKAAGDGGRFTAGIDAIVFSREPFKPNGVEKPYGRPLEMPRPTQRVKPEDPTKPSDMVKPYDGPKDSEVLRPAPGGKSSGKPEKGKPGSPGE